MTQFRGNNDNEPAVVNSTVELEQNKVWSQPILLVIITYVLILMWIYVWLVITRKLPWCSRLLKVLGLSDIEVHAPFKMSFEARSMSSPITPVNKVNLGMKNQVAFHKPFSKFNNKSIIKRSVNEKGNVKRTATLTITSTSSKSMSKCHSLSKSATKWI